jgi:hypothetical protein
VTGRDVRGVTPGRSDHLILLGMSCCGESHLVTFTQRTAGARVARARGGTLEVVIDRRLAIARALAAARPGDLVAILGHGPTTREATDARWGFRWLDDRRAERELA